MKQKCSKCPEIKNKIHHNDEYDNRGQKVFRDEDKKRWAGNVCPECHSKRVLGYLRNAAIKKREGAQVEMARGSSYGV